MLMLQEEQHQEGISSFGGRRKKTFQWAAILKKKNFATLKSCVHFSARWESEGAAQLSVLWRTSLLGKHPQKDRQEI